MTSDAFVSPSYSRLNPEVTGKFRRSAAKPTRVQSAVEVTLFAVFGISIILSAIALYSIYSPAHQSVPNRVAAGIAAGRVNVLVIASTQRANSVSTESLTLVSVQPRSGQAALIALPKNLWVKVKNYGSHRLGTALNIGESSGYPGEGPGLLSDTVENVIGQPVHAYVRIDTDDLRTTVDALGGIDLVIPHSFYERKHRDRFLAGPAHLSGERALRYAQSTAVMGPQGTPFARETRQQQVIAAVIRKISHTPEIRARLASAKLIRENSSSNLTTPQVDQLCGAVSTASSIKHVTLEPLVTTFEVKSIFDAGVAVRPKNGNFDKMHELARNVFVGAQPIASVH